MRASLISVVVLVLVVAGFSMRPQQPASRPVSEPGNIGFRIVFGVGDEQPRDWSGQIELSSGRLPRLEGWQFAGTDRVDGMAWKAASKTPPRSRATNIPSTPAVVEPLGIIPVGVQGVLAAPAPSRITVKTTPGEFSFETSELLYGRPLKFLNGVVVVERQPVSERVTTPEFEDDYPSVAVRRDGAVWVTWIGYRNRAEEIFARSYKDGRWSEPVRVSPSGGDFFRTAMAEDARGRLWVIWSAQQKGKWDLQARSLRRGRWSTVTQLTRNGSNIFHSLARDRQGRLALAWMSLRQGQGDIYLKTFDGNRWSDEVKVSVSAANDWEPSVALDSSGTAWVAWDSYDRGSYNVLLRSVSGGRAGELLRVTDSPRFHARASVAVDSQDRIWVAWEDSQANWGKDWGYWASSTPWQGPGSPLYLWRSVHVAVLDHNDWKSPARELIEAVPAGLRHHVQSPQLLADAAGRIWAMLRIRTFVRTQTADAWAAGGRWEPFLTVYAGGEWLPAIPLPDGVGRLETRVGAAFAPDGKWWGAWPTDQRRFGNPPTSPEAGPGPQAGPLAGFGAIPANYDVFTGSVDPSAVAFTSQAAGPDLVATRPEEPSSSSTVAAVHPQEDEDIRRIRSYEIRSGGKSYHIYRGDMHRHTDISADGAGDGSVFDLFRYAMDAARLDYGMVTDHNSGFDQEYSWWRIEKVDDLFQMPGFFTALFGYERSVSYPNGHRNVAFAQRGVRTLPVAPTEPPQKRQVKTNTGPVLYPYLKQNRGIAFSHTSHTGMGTDWRDNDPDVEPLVEIFQGMRTSAEHEGAPKAPVADKPATHQGGYEPAGYVWNAWAKGYKLGVQASSDHISTHMSYSCIISEDFSREGLLNAMRRRHSYAATDNIILDVRMQDGGREYIQGDAFAAGAAGRVTVKVIGTRPIADIQVIKNNRFVYAQKPNQREAEFGFNDMDVQPGESYYYVRVVQDDGQIAWSSPIWVRYE